MHFDLITGTILVVGLVIAGLLYVGLHTDLVGDVSERDKEGK